MNLHQDKQAFLYLLESINSRTGYRMDVLEKDYYIVLVLKELSEKQKAGLPAYFKGGTALYKALKTMNRFSEDIDISVNTEGCTRSQNDRRLERATKKYSSLKRDPSAGRTNRSEVISIYNYDSVVDCDLTDALQRFGKLKVEATSFTISAPIEELQVSTLLYEHATVQEREILQNKYGMSPFSVSTITMERIFVDKLFAAEAYVRSSADRHRAFEAAKHLYDLVVLKKHPKILKLLTDEKKLKQLLDIRMEEEINRLDGIPGIYPSEFLFFESIANNNNVRNEYTVMQSQYVLRMEDQIDFDTVTREMRDLHAMLMRNREWNKYNSVSERIKQAKKSLNARNAKEISKDKNKIER